jgi:Acetyltransferase (GNAT) domain
VNSSDFHNSRALAKPTLLSPDNANWRAFAVEHATSPMQNPRWLDALTSAYRLEARVVALTDAQDAILAALPMISSRLHRRPRWTSLPFTDTLEPVSANRACRDELLVSVAENSDSDAILIRTHASVPGWFSREVGTVQVIDLTNGAEGVLRGAAAGTRRQVKRAQRPEVGLSARPITSRSEFLGASLDLTAESRRRLGAPTQPRRYWTQVWGLHERGDALTIGVYLDHELVANGVFMIGSRHAVYKYGASTLATRHLRTNYLMFATAFDHLAARGLQSMDFGITDLQNASLRRFKAQWGGEEQPAYFSATHARLLPDTLEPGRVLTATIQHTPVFVGRAIGSLAYPFAA